MIARTNAHADSNKSNYQRSSPTAGLQKHSESPTFQQIQLVSNHWHPNNPLASLGAQCTRGFQQIQLPTRRSNCVLAKIQGKSNIPANPTSEQPLDPDSSYIVSSKSWSHWHTGIPTNPTTNSAFQLWARKNTGKVQHSS